jgi:alkaline phosphatase D
MAITRRTFLQATPIALAPLLPACGDDDPLVPSTFQHGVASGDPLATAVVIWTRISGASGSVEVEWAVASDADFVTVIARGVAATDEDADHTVKVDVVGLEPGTTYYYRFTALDADSPIGRTRTAREGATDRLRFALASCSNYPYGFFNAYAAIAQRADLDAVIHLGDYIYEYAEGDFGTGTALGRAPDPGPTYRRRARRHPHGRERHESLAAGHASIGAARRRGPPRASADPDQLIARRSDRSVALW